MSLEESIGKVTEAVFPHGYGLKDPQVLQTALRQFAEAISAKASEGRQKFSCKGQTAQVYCNDPNCGDRDPEGIHYSMGDPRRKPPEPKECGPDKLPTAVQMKIEVLKAASLSRELKWSELEELARLCFEVASRGRG